MTDNCEICIEPFNKRLRQKIKCQYCTFEACRTCCCKYILNESFPKCMNTACGREWTRQYIRTILPQSFINTDLKEHREKILFDKERALLPATQPDVERQVLREQRQKRIADIREEIRVLYSELYDQQRRLYRNDNTPEDPNRERSRFIRPCPDGECRGFLSTQWKCGLCNKWSCPNCHEVKGLEQNCEHTCDPNNVATANLLRQDTKSCPNCGTGIFKIEGCDQMWCTECHTAFSWTTGRIETNIHNPHYYEWMRRNGTLERNPNDVQCGQELTDRFVRGLYNDYLRHRNRLDTTNNNIGAKITKFTDICRSVIHIRFVDLPRFQYNEQLNNLELRIKYLRNKISEADFKRALQIQEKRNQKNREIHNVLRLIIDTTTDIAYRFNSELQKADWNGNMAILKEFGAIRDYANECLLDISKTYNSIQYQITEKMKVEKVEKPQRN